MSRIRNKDLKVLLLVMKVLGTAWFPSNNSTQFDYPFNCYTMQDKQEHFTKFWGHMSHDIIHTLRLMYAGWYKWFWFEENKKSSFWFWKQRLNLTLCMTWMVYLACTISLRTHLHNYSIMCTSASPWTNLLMAHGPWVAYAFSWIRVLHLVIPK